ncbi:MAG: glycoside hydrolase family 38 C-terminal domain-containing protein [Candidatus Gastranaerophilaceae bacterium]|jgi:alpha-mannosidase
MKVFAYVHTHWDREWYQPFEEYRLRLIELMDKLLDDLQSEKLNHFYFDGQTAAIEDYLEIFPEKEPLIKELIKEDKISIGPWYVLADEFLVSGESLVRNLLIGINKSKELGCDNFVGYLPDAFGHIDDMPRIFSSFGIENAIVWRGIGEQKSLFKWISKDGSSVNAHHLIEGYFQDILNQEWTIDKKAKSLTIFLDKIVKYTDIKTVLLPIGADHLATAIDLTKQISEINQKIDKYDIKLSSLKEYIEKVTGQTYLKPCRHAELVSASHDLAIPKQVRNDVTKVVEPDPFLQNIDSKNIKEVHGELRNNSRSFILSGTFSSRLYLKRQNARSSWLLSKIAEPLQSLLQNTGFSISRQNQLDYAWKLLLQNHPHDSICGCSIDPVHREMLTRFEKTNQVSNGIISRCLRDVANKVSKDEFAVINLSNYEYTGVLKLKTDKDLPNTNWQSIDCELDSASEGHCPFGDIGYKPNFSAPLVGEEQAVQGRVPLGEGGFAAQKTAAKKEFPPELLYNIEKIPVQEDYTNYSEYLVYVNDLKPCSLNIISTKKLSNSFESVETSKNSLKNEFVELKVNENGSLNIKNLKNNLEFQNLHLFENMADVGDTYNFSPIKTDKPLKPILKRSYIIENGTLRGQLRLIYEIKIPEKAVNNEKRSRKTITHSLGTDITLSAHSKMVEFETTWENKSKDHILQLKFNLPQKITKTFSEDNFGLIERNFDPDYSLRKNMPAETGKELKTNTACMQRFVWVQGFGLITEGLCEYGVHENELYMTLLRSVGILSQGKMGTRGQAAGPPLPTIEAQCPGKQVAKYAVCLTGEPKELFKQSDFFMGNILAQKGFVDKTTAKNVEFIKTDNPNIYTYAIKSPQKNSEKGLIVRLMNISDKKQILKADFGEDKNKIFEVNLLEKKLSDKNLQNLDIIFKPNELKTLYIL